MRRILLTLGFCLAALFAQSSASTEAVNRSFAERFAADKKQTGTTGTYNFDRAHSIVGFRVKHMGLIEVPGFFRDFTGTVNYNAEDVTKSSVEFTAKATSIDTGIPPRDKHLRSADFFDVDKFPELTFKSNKIEKRGKNWQVTGDLTMRGVTKTVTFPFEIAGWLPADDRSGGKMGIIAETSLNRRDFGVSYGGNLPTGTPVLSDEVKVELQIEAGKARPAAAAAPGE